ncbi:MAG: hypothetical protein R3221_12685 [Spongiibacter sp.]|nr:hypothetical protein [Spongiibacter sp.]
MSDPEKIFMCARSGVNSCPDKRSTDMTNEDLRQLIKQAQMEGAEAWLDKKFMQFGKWSFYGISAAAFIFLVKLLIKYGQV